MDNMKVKTEYERLLEILKKAEVPDQKISVLLPVIDNMAWQRVKLDETREEMQEASVVCEYNNGGGQEGIRENPIFKGYVNLWRAYMIGLEKYTSSLPKEFQEEATKEGLSVLDQVKGMVKKNNDRKSAT